jgi:hypothetical protein
LREVLKEPDYFKVYLKAYNDERTRLARGAVKDRANLEPRSGEIKRETDRIWDAMAKLGADPATVAERLKALEAEREHPSRNSSPQPKIRKRWFRSARPQSRTI